MSVHDPAAAFGGAPPAPDATPASSPAGVAKASIGASASHVKYEMAHDVLARQVFRTASSDAQTRRKVEKFIRDERSRWEERHGPRLTPEDFDYIKPHLDAVNLEEADRQFVRDAEHSLQDERERARRKARNLNFIKIGLSLAFAATAVVMFALWQQGKDRLAELQSSYEQLDEREGLLYKLMVNMEMREATCDGFGPEVCDSIKDLLRVVGEPLDSQRESAYRAVTEARAFALSKDRFDYEVLFRYQAVQFVHGDVLKYVQVQLATDPNYVTRDLENIGQAASDLDKDHTLAESVRSLSTTVQALDTLVTTRDRIRALSDPSATATLKEKRAAYLDYLDQVTALRGSQGQDAEAVRALVADINSQFETRGNVVRVAICNDRVDNFCPSTPGPATLRAGRTAYATVWYAATRPRQRVEFRWAQNGVPRGQGTYVVESVNPAGYRVFAQVTNPQAGNWEFQVYNEQRQLVDKSVFTVQ